jgi:DNA repair protein SbcC/Rad50
MIIKRLKIGSFGKLKNMSIDLTKGFNIIYGENEAGKSTMQAFIKAMLYGMNSQKKSIGENERKKYLPWSGEAASGELVFEDDKGEEYTVSRTFRTLRKEDDSSIYHSITGTNGAYFDPMCSGRELLGLGEEAFEKTLFIKQLGAEVTRDKEDEIMKKLSNLEQTGDENASYYKAIKILEEGKRNLQGVRKSGKLDLLKSACEELKKEERELLRLQEESVEDFIKLNNTCDKRDKIYKEIYELEKLKSNLKASSFIKEYEQVSKYREEVAQHEEDLSQLEAFLAQGEAYVDEEFIDFMKKSYIGLNEKREMLEVRRVELRLQESRMEEAAERLKEFAGFEKLEEDIDRRIISLQNEVWSIEEKLEQCGVIEDELKKLEGDLSVERDRLGAIRVYEFVDEEREGLILGSEDRLKELRVKLQSSSKQDNLNIRLDILKYKEKNASLMVLAGGTICAFGAIAGLLQGLSYLAASLLGVVVLVYGILQRKKIFSSREALEIELNGDSNLEFLNGELENTLRILENEYRSLGARDYAEFMSGLRRYRDYSNSIEVIKSRIDDKILQLEKFDREVLEKALEKNKKFIRFLYSHCRVNSIDEFIENLKSYRLLSAEILSIEKEVHFLKKALNKMENEIACIESDLKDRLTQYGTINREENLKSGIDYLQLKLKERSEIRVKIDLLQTACRTLLKERSFEQMKEEAARLDSAKGQSSVAMPMMEAEAIDDLLREKNNELIQTERTVKDIENRIQNRFNNKKSIAQIQEEISIAQVKIIDFEEKIRSMDIATETLKEAFSHIQKSFGPRLNRTVGKILERITNGKYSDVKISENYEVKIVDSDSNNIKDLDFFSSGTWDQIYFSLRMAIISVIFTEEGQVPIILDDAFIQYDDIRLKLVLDYLYKCSKKYQIILFTCQKREIEALGAYADMNFINI